MGNALLLLSVSSALVYEVLVPTPPTYLRMATKTASTALLSVISYIRGGPPLLVAALALGSLGDAFLAWEGEGVFISGLASFLAAHILYITLFTQLGAGYALIPSETWRLATAVVMGLLTPTMIAILVPRVERGLKAPIVVYSSAIYVMVLSALTLDDARTIVGAVLFTASDAILAIDRFLTPAIWMQYTVWALYYSGQLLMMLGSLAST